MHPAGWQPDPTSPNRERWWDGSAWTSSTRALPPDAVRPDRRAGDDGTDDDFDSNDPTVLDLRQPSSPASTLIGAAPHPLPAVAVPTFPSPPQREAPSTRRQAPSSRAALAVTFGVVGLTAVVVVVWALVSVLSAIASRQTDLVSSAPRTAREQAVRSALVSATAASRLSSLTASLAALARAEPSVRFVASDVEPRWQSGPTVSVAFQNDGATFTSWSGETCWVASTAAAPQPVSGASSCTARAIADR